MARNPRPKPDEPLSGLPAPCVWMSAGLVAYRLCDRDFDCERCPLDAALCAGGSERGHSVPPLPSPRDWEFPDDRSYHPAHTWAGDGENDAESRCGIDALAATLLQNARGVVLPPLGSRIRQGRIACWLIDGATLIPLRAPLTGRVAARNRAVLDEPELVTHRPYTDGWLLRLDLPRRRARRRGLWSAERAREHSRRQWSEFCTRLAAALPGSERLAGATLLDGGEPVADVRQLLGTSRYYELVLELLR